MNLYDYQVDPVRHTLTLLRQGQNVVNGSDMGTGKTVMACAVIKDLDLPTLVLAPKISRTEWLRTGVKMGVDFDCTNPELVRTGKTPYGTWQFPKPRETKTRLVCTACQLEVTPGAGPACIHQPQGIHCVKPKNVPHNFGRFTWSDGVKFLVVDECHRYGAMKSLNADMLIAARRQGIPVLAMSATAADSPLGLRALGYVLGLHNLVNFYPWAFARGVKKHPFGGLYFGGDDSERAIKMARLHKEIFPSRGVRVRISDLGDKFPPCQITTELYDLDAKDKIDALYAEMDQALLALRDGRSEEELAVTKVLRARQDLEMLMVPVFHEIVEQSLEAGAHVAVFLNFKASIDEMAERFETQCRIEGGQDPEERQEYIDRFGRDEEPVILLNAQAGGIAISLPDLLGKHFRVGVVSLGYSPTVTRQIFGRLPRATSKSKSFYRIPLIAGTVQEKIHRAVAPKLNQIDLLNEGDLFAASNLDLTNLPLSALFSRAS